MSEAVNACPDCGSTERTMNQAGSTRVIVWSCQNGHTWQDPAPAEPVKPARRSGATEEKK